MQKHLTRAALPFAIVLSLIFVPEVQAQDVDPATMRPAYTRITAHSFDLSGRAEVPGPGDNDGSGRAFVVLNEETGSVCYTLEATNIDAPTAAHIHEGAIDASGPPVVNFDFARNGYGACVTGVERATIERIRMNPQNFYVNVHNDAFAAGAIRGQLSR